MKKIINSENGVVVECDSDGAMKPCPCEICLDVNDDKCIKETVDKPCPCEMCNFNPGNIGVIE